MFTLLLGYSKLCKGGGGWYGYLLSFITSVVHLQSAREEKINDVIYEDYKKFAT